MIHTVVVTAGGLLFGICLLSGLAFIFGIQVYYETSDSMRPVIGKGDLLLVRESDTYDVGDIVVFHTGYSGQASCVTHRIAARVSGGFHTKGDANGQADFQTVTRKMIAGKVTGTIPYYGYVCRFIQRHQAGTLLCIFWGMIVAGMHRRIHEQP